MADPASVTASLCVVAGEPSGDLLAASVVKHLHSQLPNLNCWGMTGPAMREAGVVTLVPLEQQSVMGFTQVLRNLPTLLRVLRTMEQAILLRKPSVVLLIDYPGFNLRLAKRLRKRGFQGQIVQMVSPSVWAHGRGRIRSMAATLDLLLTIFPFEARYFEHSGLQVRYVGNPVAERVRQDRTTAPPLIESIAARHPLVGLFPGSRPQDLQMHLPTLLETARKLLHHHPHVRFVLSCAHERYPELLHELCRREDSLILGETLLLIDRQANLGLMPQLTAAIAKSGTMTLELGLKGVPTVCVYGISWINALIVKLILRVRLPFYCIVNLLCEREVFPECIFRDFNPARILESLEPFLSPTPQRKSCKEQLQALQKTLAEPAHPSEHAASLIATLLVSSQADRSKAT